MENCPDNYLFAQSHEWVDLQNNVAKVGISAFACSQLGDIVFVELPEVGSEINKGDEVATVESVKTAADIYAPVSGTVSAVNEKLIESPEFLSAENFSEAWLFEVTVNADVQTQDLLPAKTYHSNLETA
jgi:glycine cleavage system H protein